MEIHLQSHFHVSQHPSETFVTRPLGQMGAVGSGQTTGVNSIVPFVQVQWKQFSVHVSPQAQIFFLLRSVQSMQGDDVGTTAEDSGHRHDRKMYYIQDNCEKRIICRKTTWYALCAVL